MIIKEYTYHLQLSTHFTIIYALRSLTCHGRIIMKGCGTAHLLSAPHSVMVSSRLEDSGARNIYRTQTGKPPNSGFGV